MQRPVEFFSSLLGSTSAISDRAYQIQVTTCGDFRKHRGPHDGKETPEDAISLLVTVTSGTALMSWF